MARREPLQYNYFYHIYNRGNKREMIIRRPENYRFFLQRCRKYIEPLVEDDWM